MQFIKCTFTSGAKVGEKYFANWYQVTNIQRPIVRCRVCNKKTTSETAMGFTGVPCTSFHKNGKVECVGSGMPGIIIRKLPVKK